MVVDLGGEGVVVVVLWSVGFALRVDVRVHFKADSEYVEVQRLQRLVWCAFVVGSF